MSGNELQRFVDLADPPSVTPVDLADVAKELLEESENSLRELGSQDVKKREYVGLLIDSECCLSRLYAGGLSNWVCGGDWNRVFRFIQALSVAGAKNNIQWTIYFNGSFEADRMDQWTQKQISALAKIQAIIRHVYYTGNEPPRYFWIPPTCMLSTLRIMCRSIGIQVSMSAAAHHSEAIAFVKKQHLHGLLGDHPDYLILCGTRYFSAKSMRLTHQGAIYSREVDSMRVAQQLEIDPSRLGILATLLGNHILKEKELERFHSWLCANPEPPPSVVFHNVLKYVKKLKSVDDLTQIAADVFGSTTDYGCEKLRRSFNYYCQGCQRSDAKINEVHLQDETAKGPPVATLSSGVQSLDPSSVYDTDIDMRFPPESGSSAEPSLCFEDEVSKLLQEDSVSPIELSQGYEVTRVEPSTSAGSNNDPKTSSGVHLKPRERHGFETDINKLIEITPMTPSVSENENLKSKTPSEFCLKASQGYETGINKLVHQGASIPPSWADLSSEAEDELVYKLFQQARIESTHSYSSSESENVDLPIGDPLLPADREVLKNAYERHTRGMIHPYIYQILAYGCIKLPVIMEGYPNSIEVYRPLRQLVYGVLFNINQQRDGLQGEAIPIIVLKEWVYTQENHYTTPHYVQALPLGVALPSIRSFLFSGPALHDDRLHAFMTCMRCDNAMMYDSDMIPPNMIVLCCVLRYLLAGSEDASFIDKSELDAFLAQAVDPELKNYVFIQNLEIARLSTRALTLASLFMEGVDHAILANDACGTPLNFELFGAWNFFDGKLFHYKLEQSRFCKNLADLCNYQYRVMSLVEQMRAAITNGLNIKYQSSEYNFLEPRDVHRSGSRLYRSLSEDHVPVLGGISSHYGPIIPMVPYRSAQMPRGNQRRGRSLVNQGHHEPRPSSCDSSRSRSANVFLGMARGAEGSEEAPSGENTGFNF